MEACIGDSIGHTIKLPLAKLQQREELHVMDSLHTAFTPDEQKNHIERLSNAGVFNSRL